MPYCELKDIKNIIPEQELVNLTNDMPDYNSEINNEEVEAAVKYADEIINCFLRAKYNLPLSFIPAILGGLSADITCYRLYKRRPCTMPEHIKDGYNNALDILNRIQTGKMLLDMPKEHPEENIPRQQALFLTNKTEKSKIFSDEMMRVYGGRA